MLRENKHKNFFSSFGLTHFLTRDNTHKNFGTWKTQSKKKDIKKKVYVSKMPKEIAKNNRNPFCLDLTKGGKKTKNYLLDSYDR